MALVAFLFCSSSSSKQGAIKLRVAESRILGQTMEARKELWRKVIKIFAVLKGSWKLFLVRHLVFNLFHLNLYTIIRPEPMFSDFITCFSNKHNMVSFLSALIKCSYALWFLLDFFSLFFFLNNYKTSIAQMNQSSSLPLFLSLSIKNYTLLTELWLHGVITVK